MAPEYLWHRETAERSDTPGVGMLSPAFQLWGRAAELSRSPHRDIWPSELDLMAQLADFELESRWADWDGSASTADSRSHVSVYR